MLRDLLLTRVHNILRDQLREMINKKPSMTFQEVYDHLQKYFSVDDPHFWRRKWQEVKLKVQQNDKIELSELLLFRAKFETALAKVVDYTDNDVIEAVLKNLPSY